MPRRVSSDAQIWTKVLESDDLRLGRPQSSSAGKGSLSEAWSGCESSMEKNPGH